MQDVDDYEKHVHTTGQAVQKIQSCCSLFGYRVNYRLLTTFQAAMLFVLGLQANDMIVKLLAHEDFNYTQLTVIMIFIVVSIFVDYVKEHYVSGYKEQVGHIDTGFSIPHGYSHTFYQK
jgi:hypothetical protein